MTLSAVELEDVCREIEARLAGQPVHKIVQPDDETLLVRFGGGRWLLVNASARYARVHLTEDKPAGTGYAAPAFCMLARKHLLGARLHAVTSIEGERACELDFVTPDDSPRLRLFLFGPAAQLQIVARSEDEETQRVLGAIGPARRLYEALPEPHPSGAQQQRSRFDGAQPSMAIDAAYREAGTTRDVEAARAQARQRLSAELRKATRLEERLRDDLARTQAAESRRKEADLLLAHLHEIPRGASEVTLADDFTDGSPIVVVLDPARSAKENAERLYKEQRRLHRARGAVEKRLAEAHAKVGALTARITALETATDAALLVDARTPQPLPQRKGHAERALPFKAFTSASGAPIYVGRGAGKNDELTFKVARGNDLWLHARDVPGAHVIVPLPGGRDVDAETLVDAATLAAYHSSAREEAQVDIGYALRKHVRKPKGAAPGAVLVSQQKTMRVRMEPERLARLLATGRR